MHRLISKTVALVGAILILAACGGAPGQDANSSGHAVDNTVSFQDSAPTAVKTTTPTAANTMAPTQAAAASNPPTSAAAIPTLASSANGGLTATGAPSATGHAVVFKADLKTANENPPIADAEASCSGSATITFTATTAEFDVTFTGCPASAVINIGHIHEGATGVNGPVKIDSSLKAGELKLVAGRGTLSRTVTADATLISTMMANPADYYVNFHSTAHPGGVMRAQLTRT